jgi:membrane protein DedA with SNARE-associated domain
MEDIIIKIINDFGYLGIGMLIAIENIFPPIPSEIILSFGGFLTTYTSLNIWGVIAAATMGSLIGAIILYLIGRVLNEKRLEMLFESKLAKLLRLKKEDVGKAIHWFDKSGNKTVFICRFIPIIRSLISIPAGIAGMNFYNFLLLTAVGTFLWNTVLVFLGSFAGDTWLKIAGYFDTYSMITAVVLVLISIIIGVVFVKQRFLKKE